MKRFIYCVAVFAALFFIVAAANAAQYPEWPSQNGQPIQCNFGYKKIATPTITLDNITPVDLADYLPEGTLGFELRAVTGSFIINHPENIATGTNRLGHLVEEGGSFVWNGLAGSFVGAVIASDSSCILAIDGAWGYGR
jgi:hypothetical protein